MTMDKIAVYFENLGLLGIVDGFVCLTVLVLAFIFFYHKRCLRVFFLLLAVTALKITAGTLNALSAKESFLISSMVLDYVYLFSLVTVIVVYQSDFRSLFQHIAAPSGVDLFAEGYGSDDELHEATEQLLSALQAMAKQNTGAIIIITPTTMDSHILRTGTDINAVISSSLLVSVFNTKSPLHDGAVIVKGNKILSAGCFLPLTQDAGVAKELGTRHRAALGITEESDVMAIVVSEETGIISVAMHGLMQRYMTIEKLKEKIETIYGISPLAMEAKSFNKNEKNKKRFRR
ncbi:MAG: diadenylate cyclase [Clostridia bacterium]